MTATPPPPSNVTSIHSMIPVISASLGISSTTLGIIFLAIAMIPLLTFRLPKVLYPLTMLGVTFFGVSLDILPSWLFILSGLFTAIFLAKEATAIFRGQPYAQVANMTTGITISETSPSLPEPSNWNCKNCGGPNIEQVKCEWCGQVKE